MARIVCIAALIAALPMSSAAPTDGLAATRSPRSGARTPQEEHATFKLADGFEIQLVASEPDVVDPVAMCFDARGRLFVCEMRGYPNGGLGTGKETRGKIKCLTDADGDGRFETSRVFAEGLRFPMGITPYKNGLLVAVAPDILYLEDTDDDGKADKTTVLYTGFNLANIQQMVNGLQWGMDNWIYGVAGNDGGMVSSGESKDARPLSLRNRGLRFQPWRPGSLEPTSGGGQYGLTADDAQHWFTATNSEHLRQIVLPDTLPAPQPLSGRSRRNDQHCRARRRGKGLPHQRFRGVAGGTHHAPRRRPRFQTLLAHRTRSRRVHYLGLQPAHLHRRSVPGGLSQQQLRLRPRQQSDPPRDAARQGKRVHGAARRPRFRIPRLDGQLVSAGATAIGPDGAIYLLDFYREVIETPLSLPEDIKKKLNLESRGRGRVWRIAPAGFKPGKLPDVSHYTAVQLADELLSGNSARRLTAQRLLVERQDKAAVGPLRERLTKAVGKPGRANLLWALHGLGQLTEADVLPIFDDPAPGCANRPCAE